WDIVVSTRVEREAPAHEVHQVAVRVDEARKDGAPAEVHHRLGGEAVDVALSPGERDAALSHPKRVDKRVPRLERVDASGGQQHRHLPEVASAAPAQPESSPRAGRQTQGGVTATYA